MYVLPTCIISVPMCAEPTEVGRGHWIPRNWSYRRLLATMWVLKYVVIILPLPHKYWNCR